MIKFDTKMIKIPTCYKLKESSWAILVFYIIAVAFRIITTYVLPDYFHGFSDTICGQLVSGMGPLAGAICVMFFFHKKLFCTIFGKSSIRSILCIAVPMLLLVLFNRENGLKFAMIFLGCITYAFFEEVGWRGYLLGEFSTCSQWKRVVVISLFWFFWHADIIHLSSIIFLMILLFSSWGLDQLAFDTRSLVLCSCFHGLFNLLKHGNGIWNEHIALFILAVSIVFWFVIWYLPIKRKNKE